MERNIRSAKAYLRSRVITIDGSEAEFDGVRRFMTCNTCC
ncbi:unnamed protein product [Brugia pahangi]|uniref:Transposase n=1 Tax=Brugia pahangi TaxID=6280 RepID=A0A0N4TGR1_BRUPA|nr:unnamed protein product [Brugia pahangi]